MRFFKPRFSLATLLIAVTVTALLLWGVPEWREFQRRNEFERAACQLRAGVEPDLFHTLPPHAHSGHLRRSVFFDANHHSVTALSIFYKRYWYCIYAQQEQLTAEDKQKMAEELLAANAREKLYLSTGCDSCDSTVVGPRCASIA